MESMILVVAFAGLGFVFSFAYLADREKQLRWLLIPMLAGVNLIAVAVGAVYAVMGILPGGSEALAESMSVMGFIVSPEAAAQMSGRLPWFGVISLAVGLVGWLLLLPIARKAVARVLPIDPDRAVHTLALTMAAHLVAISAVVGLFLPVLLADETVMETAADAMSGSGLGPLWAQSVGFVVLSVLGVGWLVQRDGRDVLARLGLTRSLHWRWWVVGTGVALLSSFAVDGLWSMVDPRGLEQVQRLSEALFQPYLGIGLLGAITMGLSAGIGEEILFRGAAQPRLGLIFTSLLFAAVHTQYTVSLALVQILIVGLVLGTTRMRTNTTTAIATHATYNLLLALYAIYFA